jgi:2-polyprenyl-6-methoxyphenol hydroxylase-like FAD-dependent oxidoreductase
MARMDKLVRTPVLIVGAGPVGLQIAMDLGWRGTDCVVIDKADGAPVLHPRAAGISPRTMEFCRRWGIVDQVRQFGFPADFDMSVVYCTALLGHLIGREDYPPLERQRQVPFSPENQWRCPQTVFDPLLASALRSYSGVRLYYKHRLAGFEQHDDGVRADVVDLEDGSTSAIEAEYLVACDGSASEIATALGIEVEGKRALSYSLNAVIQAPQLFKWHAMGEAVRYLFIGPEGTWANLTAVDGHDRWRFTLIGTEEKLELAKLDMNGEIRRAFGTDRIPFEILAMAPWRRSETIAREYRRGRILIAGDAAHTMSPTGGHGMNTGAGDAVDLGWKLDAVLRGWGGKHLLDSYEAERRPVAVRNARNSSENFRTWLSAARSSDVTADTAAGLEARELIGRSLRESLRAEWDSWGIQLGYRYEDSPICISDDTPAPPDGPSEYVQSARPGSRAPHAWLPDGRSTLDLFGRGFVLLRLCAGDLDVGALARAAAEKQVPLSVMDINTREVRDLYGAPLVLVRPDGHCAWRGDAVPKRPGEVIDIVRGARRRAVHASATDERGKVQPAHHIV